MSDQDFRVKLKFNINVIAIILAVVITITELRRNPKKRENVEKSKVVTFCFRFVEHKKSFVLFFKMASMEKKSNGRRRCLFTLPPFVKRQNFFSTWIDFCCFGKFEPQA